MNSQINSRKLNLTAEQRRVWGERRAEGLAAMTPEAKATRRTNMRLAHSKRSPAQKRSTATQGWITRRRNAQKSKDEGSTN